MKKDKGNWLDYMMSGFFWIKFFIAPVFLFSIIAVIIYSNFHHEIGYYFACLVFACGIIVGIFFAEYIRKRYGSIEAGTKIMESSDIDDWVTKNKNAHKGNDDSKTI